MKDFLPEGINQRIDVLCLYDSAVKEYVYEKKDDHCGTPAG